MWMNSSARALWIFLSTSEAGSKKNTHLYYVTIHLNALSCFLLPYYMEFSQHFHFENLRWPNFANLRRQIFMTLEFRDFAVILTLC